MVFNINKSRISFNEGYKPKSLKEFLKGYASIGSEEDLTDIFNKLNGNDITADKQPKEVKKQSGSRKSIPSVKGSGE